MERMNVFCGSVYVARIELFSVRCLLYAKMLPRARKETVLSQKRFLDNSCSLGASRANPISCQFFYMRFR